MGYWPDTNRCFQNGSTSNDFINAYIIILQIHFSGWMLFYDCKFLFLCFAWRIMTLSWLPVRWCPADHELNGVLDTRNVNPKYKISTKRTNTSSLLLPVESNSQLQSLHYNHSRNSVTASCGTGSTVREEYSKNAISVRSYRSLKVKDFEHSLQKTIIRWL